MAKKKRRIGKNCPAGTPRRRRNAEASDISGII
jgi:hypothetical protein